MTTRRSMRGGLPGRCWSHVLDLALVLWVVRVPFAFTLLGLLLLGMAPQAQDLFVELALTPSERVGALPYGTVLLFLIMLMFVWAMPTHYAARLLLMTDRRFRLHARRQALRNRSGCIAAIEGFVPRALGALPFIAVLIGIVRSGENLPLFDTAVDDAVMQIIRINLVILAGLVVATLVLFGVYLMQRRRFARSALGRAAKRLALIVAPLLRSLTPKRIATGDPDEEAQRNLGKALLLLVFLVFAAVLAAEPNWAAEMFPRALAVPLVLGGWLPVLAYLSALGRSLRAPLILGVVIGIAALVAVFGDNHSVRRIAAAPGEGPQSRPTMDAAVRMWMRENACADAAASCPRPIIVAAAGGASRAGFFTASILGYLLQEAPYNDLNADRVRRQLFAISSVSGSSVGAVMSVAALAERADSTRQPCVRTPFPLWWGQTIGNWRDCYEALASGDFLTPVFIGLSFHDLIRFGWWRDRAAMLEEAWERRYERVIDRPKIDDKPERGCSGLTCPFLTLRPREGRWVPILALNGTSEAGGNRVITTVLAPAYKPQTPGACPTSNRRDDRQDCLLFAQTRDFHQLLQDDTPPPDWRARLQISLLREPSTPLDDVRLSTAAHNSARFPLISPSGNVRNRKHQVIDRILDGGYFENYGALTALELAQAIRAVEPGLHPFVVVISNDPDDPLDPEDDDAAPARAERAPVPLQLRQRRLREPMPAESVRQARDADDSLWFADLVTPVTTFVNTRTARGILAVTQLRNALYGAMPHCPGHVVHLRVWPQQAETEPRSRAVSMSWWLSLPIQRHLHQQTEREDDSSARGKNEHENGRRLLKLWGILHAPASSCAPPRPPT